MLNKIVKLIIQRKFITAFIIALALGGYWGYGKIFSDEGAVRYAVAQAQKGTLIASVSGSGQISAADQMDIKPKTSGKITWISVRAGEEVKQWQTLMILDNDDAKKAIADSELDLQETKLRYEKSKAQAPFDYERKLESLKNAQDNLIREYENGFNALSNAYLDLPAIMTGLNDILRDKGVDSSLDNISAYKNLARGGKYDDYEMVERLAAIAEQDYRLAREKYDEDFIAFKNLSRYSADSEIENLLRETTDTVKLIAQASKSEMNLLDILIDLLSKERYGQSLAAINNYRSELKNHIGKINGYLNSLLSQQRSLENTKNSVVDIGRDIAILKIGNQSGDNPIDLQVAENNIRKKERALADLKKSLNDYIVWAPFAGTIAKINVKQGDSVSGGTALATLVGARKIAEISLNEIDAARVKVGQKTTLTFDAIPDLTLAGEVIELDTLGAVSQGVVTYTAKIAFDFQSPDEVSAKQIKTAMSVTAAIITAAKPDTLLVPNSAVKQQDGLYYVELVADEDRRTALAASAGGTILTSPTRRQPVEVGMANDDYTEIVGGLAEGDIVVARTMQSNSIQTQTQSSQSGLRIPGLNTSGGSGGGFRR